MNDRERYEGSNDLEMQEAWPERSHVIYDTRELNGVYQYQGREQEAVRQSRAGVWLRGLSFFLFLIVGLFLLAGFFAKGYLLNSGTRASLESERAVRQTLATMSQGLPLAPAVATPVKAPAEAGKHFSIFDAAKRRDGQKEAMSVMAIARERRPSVVAITTERAASPGLFQAVLPSVAGSGFIISAEGHIATNAHVVEEAKRITVHLDDGSLYAAELLGKDPLTDLAVIKIAPKEDERFVPVVFGDSSSLVVGELAVAIGNPSGTLQGSVTAGIISALERHITVGGREMTVLQTDASINAGNSGGPLINSFGEVIGVNSAKLQGDGRRVFDGIAFAVPINHAKPVLEDLILHGYVKNRVHLGLYSEFIDAHVAEYYRIAQSSGLLISSVLPDSASEEAGLQRGDFLDSFNGQQIETALSIENAKRGLKPGDTVPFTFYRKGRRYERSMTLKEYTPPQ